MGTLVIDIGNTRLAWRYRGSSGDLRFGTASHHAITDVFDELPQARKIAISSVRRDHEGEIQNWLDSILGRSQPELSEGDATHIVEVLTAAYQSAREGRTVRI